MIRNIIYDMGGVIQRYDQKLFIRRQGITDPEDAAALRTALYKSGLWHYKDTGEWTAAQLAEAVKARLPERLHEAVDNLIFRREETCGPDVYNEDIQRFMKASAGLGKRQFLLTNASPGARQQHGKVPGIGLLEGCIVSGEIGLAKPDPEIYRYALRQFGLKAEETLFIDDVAKNAAGAKAAGLWAGRYLSPEPAAFTVHAPAPYESVFLIPQDEFDPDPVPDLSSGMYTDRIAVCEDGSFYLVRGAKDGSSVYVTPQGGILFC